MNDMKMMATIDGITVQDKAEQIVAEHTARHRRASLLGRHRFHERFSRRN
ncbi:MAG: hypothetical protein HC869_15065 [Rhodospirillales bacterium]|nr:hypothetical protein [Rhodospirillales bacterium]